jgi:hypothetical protein
VLHCAGRLERLRMAAGADGRAERRHQPAEGI